MIDAAEIVGGPLSPAAQKSVASILFTWLSEVARKANGPDQESALETMRVRIEEMSKFIELGFKNRKVVVIVTGRGESTLRQLHNGTKWFDPHPDVNGMIAVAALSS